MIEAAEDAIVGIRRDRADVRVILTSGYHEQTAMHTFAGIGLVGFIQKPYRFEQLHTVVRGVLER